MSFSHKERKGRKEGNRTMMKLKRLGLVFLIMYATAIFMGLQWCGYSISILLPQLLLGVVLIFPEPLCTVLGIAHLIKSVLYENAQMYAQGVGTVFAVPSLILSYALYIALVSGYVFANRRWFAHMCLGVLSALLAFACYFATVMDASI